MTATSLPRYRSHKIVHAGKIAEIRTTADGAILVFDGINGVQGVDDAWLARHKPAVGGYYVVYAPDDYTSFSPAQAFEDGYTRCSQ